MRGATIVLMMVVGVLASGCAEPNTTNYDPVGDAAAEAELELVSVPPEQVVSCVESTKFGAYVGDAEAISRWEAANESEVALADACGELGRTDPAALATMHWNWMAAQSAIGEAPTEMAATD